MLLKLRHPPTPEFASKHADVAVAAVKQIDKVVLDYSPESLAVIDRIIQGFLRDGCKESDVRETIFCFGCYAGEVVVRSNQGRWCEAKVVLPENLLKLFPFMVVQLPNGQVLNPIAKAFKQLANGAEDSLVYFYQALTAEP
jgi:hypothetical protein